MMQCIPQLSLTPGTLPCNFEVIFIQAPKFFHLLMITQYHTLILNNDISLLSLLSQPISNNDKFTPQEFVPDSGGTANWKTEHDAKYTPIDFNVRYACPYFGCQFITFPKKMQTHYSTQVYNAL